MRVRWTEQALQDLENAYQFIAVDNSIAAKKMARIILESIEQIKKFPESGRRGRVQQTREFIIPQTPYLLIYRLNHPNIELISILHSSRKWPS